MIRRFIRYLRSPKIVTRFLFIKYVLLPLTRNKDIDLFQFDLFKEVFQEKSFIIIIIDACRYDVFKEFYKEYFQGELLKVKSLGTSTGIFLKKFVNMPEFKDVRIFSSTPHMSKNSIINRWLNTPVYPQGLDFIDLWKNNWNDDIGTVLTEDVNQIVTNLGLNNRNIIWYLPPHFPWIENVKFSKEILNESIEKNKPLSEVLLNKIKKGETNIPEIKQLYISNLRSSLCQISSLLQKLKPVSDRIIVTSDHGELLGEYNLFFHFSHLDVPELYTVPWLNVSI